MFTLLVHDGKWAALYSGQVFPLMAMKLEEVSDDGFYSLDFTSLLKHQLFIVWMEHLLDYLQTHMQEY